MSVVRYDLTKIIFIRDLRNLRHHSFQKTLQLNYAGIRQTGFQLLTLLRAFQPQAFAECRTIKKNGYKSMVTGTRCL